ncbi:MBOAT family protein [Kamptonema animale CS-326]|jgi:alginate O-acetyltransferase complex protein AlgI|uniref:MBOAT family O-acyltransferase n=1 Tax=Kamptonema animale TaxID=92934 RepID=UPI00232C6645|nr:MBOAT family O-acyltransferase [Kamptonema animale]MDB9512189.1 MBOAT family protein [Kamptonema animale CS-326]
MLFPTYQFLVFFLITFSLAISLKQRVVLYKIFLLATSLVFYSFWSLNFLGLLVGSTLINYLIVRGVYKNKYTKSFLIAGLILNIIYLGIFKYYNFFANSLFEVLNSLNIPANFQVLQIIAPVGVSFYVFRIISHLVDSYNQKFSCPGLVDYAVYITYFPQIAAGPISRAKEFYYQLNTAKKYNYEIEEVIVLILSGLFKKYTLSSFLYNFTELPFRSPQQYSSMDLILAAISYSCLIYVDFSGYSDLANGISCLLGFKPIQNFNMPYRALSLQEFWRRWHISLSEWLRDYIYIPLGGSRYGNFRKYINLLLTMAIGGFWHGAGINFIIWGVIHGIGLTVNHLCKDLSKTIHLQPQNLSNKIGIIFNWFLTFSFVTLSWVFFQTKSLEDANNFFLGIVQTDNNYIQFNSWQLYLVLIVIGLINFFGDTLTKILLKIFAIKSLFVQVSLVSMFTYVILMLGPNTVPPFIYFGF